jgi:hypothetical protein
MWTGVPRQKDVLNFTLIGGSWGHLTKHSILSGATFVPFVTKLIFIK